MDRLFRLLFCPERGDSSTLETDPQMASDKSQEAAACGETAKELDSCTFASRWDFEFLEEVTAQV